MHGVEGIKGEYHRHLLLCAKIIQNFRIFFHAILAKMRKRKIRCNPILYDVSFGIHVLLRWGRKKNLLSIKYSSDT
jgi:hypothetical protein